MSKYIPLFYTNVITCPRPNPDVALAIIFSWSGPPENTWDEYRFYFHLGSALPTKSSLNVFPNHDLQTWNLVDIETISILTASPILLT